jgi:ketosteroid isomerase-like protein
MATDSAAAIDMFNQAFNRHDVEGVMKLMTEDCVFENTVPPPDGERYQGAAAVREFWQRFFGPAGYQVIDTFMERRERD